MELSENAKRLCDAIWDYIEAMKEMPSAKQASLLDIRNLEFYKQMGTDEQASVLNEFKTIDPPIRIARSGYNYRGFHFKLNMETWELEAKAIRFASVLYTNERNRPKSVVTFDDDVEQVRYYDNVYTKRAPGHRLSFGVKAHLVDDFLYHCKYWRRDDPTDIAREHEVSKSGVVVDPNSTVKSFYSVGNVLYTKLTKAAVMKAVNACENIYRHEPNFSSTENWFGIAFAVWQTTLLDFSSFPVAVDEDIRLDEINILEKYLGANHVIVCEAKRRYDAERTSTAERDDVKKRVGDRIAAVQALVENNKSDILDYSIVHSRFCKEAYERLANIVKTRRRYSSHADEVLAFRKATSRVAKELVKFHKNWIAEHGGMDLYAKLCSFFDAEIDSDKFGAFASEIIRCIVPVEFNPLFTCPVIEKAVAGLEVDASGVATCIGLYLALNMLSNEEKIQFLKAQDSTFGFDCGFIYFSFKDSILDNDLRNAANFGLEKAYGNGDFSLELPVFVQSTSIKRYMGEKIVELCEAAGLPAISYNTKLD